MHIKQLYLSFAHKTCFENFTVHIQAGDHIAIIGKNGCGKTTLLTLLRERFEIQSVVGYVPQTIEDFNTLSGGQRFNKTLSAALALHPEVLLLDEPTNHLDAKNRESLMRMLRNFTGTLIVVSHDGELLRHCVDTLWHIDQGKIHVFCGHYNDYLQDIRIRRASIEKELQHLALQKKEMHHALMKEQVRAAKSKTRGQKSIANKKWPTVVSTAKALNAQETSGRKKAAIDHKKQSLQSQLSNLTLPDIIVPTFSLKAADIPHKTLISISDGSVSYTDHLVLDHIYLHIASTDRIALVGDNGSGKSTLMKAILNDGTVVKTGDWCTPQAQSIGYVDQHYSTLLPEKSVVETLKDYAPHWDATRVRRHLADFLFRTQEEIDLSVAQLSGGEKARLSLACLAAKTPVLLLLDEITNNLDTDTRGHVINVLKHYPGAIVVISHDQDFLQEIFVQKIYCV